jgi:hypothetical protein
MWTVTLIVLFFVLPAGWDDFTSRKGLVYLDF